MLARLSAAVWVAALALVARDVRTVPRLEPVGSRVRKRLPSVTAIVPARDEGRDVERTLALLVAQDHPRLQVVAVDDCSSDGTLAAMRRVEGVEVVEGVAPPEGWLGKPWACAQGLERAHGEWLLFLDADMRLAPQAVSAALDFAIGRGGGGATVFPRLETGGAAERIVMPVAGVLMQTAIIPSWAARSRRLDIAIGVGGFLLLERKAYERLGGHAAVRGEIVEDLALARLVKRGGGLVEWASSDGLVSLRMYQGWGELWRGWRKNAAHAWPLPVVASAAAALGLAVLAFGPWAAAARMRPAGLLGVVAQVLAVALSRRGSDIPARYALTAPLGVAFLLAVGTAALWDRARGRPASWRGRRIEGARA